MTDRDLINAIHNRLDEEPADWQARRELADLLEEVGDTAGAATQRWMVAEGRKPWRWSCQDRWVWNRHPPEAATFPAGRSLLPAAVWDHLPGGDGGPGVHRTRREAEAALLAALRAAGEI